MNARETKKKTKNCNLTNNWNIKKMAKTKAIKFTHGAKTRAAEKMGISRQSFNYKLKRNNLHAIRILVEVEKGRIAEEKALEAKANQILDSLREIA